MKEKILLLLNDRTEESTDKAIELVKTHKLQETFYYLSRFGEMLDYLRQFENIEILEYAFLAPKSEHIESIEKEIGQPLNNGVKKFYEQCGGLILWWVDKRNKRYDKIIQSYQQDICVDGSILIFNLKNVYHQGPPKFPKACEFIDKKLSAEDMAKYFHQFDYFSDYRDMMAYTGEHADNPLLVLGEDYGATYLESRLISIPDYLELIFHFCVLVESRYSYLHKYEGHKMSMLNWDREFFKNLPKPDFSEYPYSID